MDFCFCALKVDGCVVALGGCPGWLPWPLKAPLSCPMDGLDEEQRGQKKKQQKTLGAFFFKK